MKTGDQGTERAGQIDLNVLFLLWEISSGINDDFLFSSCRTLATLTDFRQYQNILLSNNSFARALIWGGIRVIS